MISPTLTLGLVQYDIAWENPQENIKRIEHLLGKKAPFDLLVLPEMWSTGFTMQPEKVAEKENGPAFQWMREQAQKYNVCICGSISFSDHQKFYNRWYCVFPDGHTHHYDKKHLFTYGKENEHYTPGNKTMVFELNGWRIMPIICYDLRFPAWCRNKEDYDLLLVAANWPSPRIHHWDALIKARAIENQSYVAAVNRIGQDPTGLEYIGHSQVIDMNGQELAYSSEDEGIETVTLHKESLSKYRLQYPFLRDMDHYSL